MADPGEGSVLDRRTLNRSLLARQLLLERAELSPASAVKHLVGLQAQNPLDPYVGLWSRLRGFDPDALGRLLTERELVRMTLMRTTLHLVHSSDALRLRPVLQAAIERAFAASPFARNLAGLALEPVLRRGAELVEREALSTAELAKALGEEWPGYDPNALAQAVRYLVPLVQVTPRGVWGRTLRPKVTTLAGWVGREPESAIDATELVRRYVRAFGPASVADIRAWSSLGGVRSLVDRLRPELVSYRDESGRELFDVPDGVLCEGSTPAPVRLLPQFDNLFLAHADRGRVFADVRWDSSFAQHGTVFVDGFLAGTWKLRRDRHASSITVELRTPVRTAVRQEVAAEADRLLALLAPEGVAREVKMLHG